MTQSICHKQDWCDREFGLEWARHVHRPMDFKERVHIGTWTLYDGFTVRALSQIGSERRRMTNIILQ